MGLGSPGRFVRDIADALRFFTRLRVGESEPGAPLDIDRIAWAAPVAGVAVGLVGALILALAALLGLPLLLRAAFATAALVARDRRAARGRARRRRRWFRRRRDPGQEARDHARQPHRRLWRDRDCARAHPARWRASRGARRRVLARGAQPDVGRGALPRRGADAARAPAASARRRRGRCGWPAQLERARRRLGLGPCYCDRARPRRAWADPCAPRGAHERRRRFVHGRVWRAARSADRPAMSRAPRNNAARSPPGADFSSGIRPPK